MRTIFQHSALLSLFTALCVTILSGSVYARDNQETKARPLTTTATHMMQLTKGQRYKPPGEIYKETC